MSKAAQGFLFAAYLKYVAAAHPAEDVAQREKGHLRTGTSSHQRAGTFAGAQEGVRHGKPV